MTLKCHQFHRYWKIREPVKIEKYKKKKNPPVLQYVLCLNKKHTSYF